MAGGSRIVLSLFDRLTDLEPRSSVEGLKNDWEQMAALKQSVARDLALLLNTRIDEADFPEEFEQLRRSVAAFGVQDYSRSPVEKEDIRKSIERAVRNFEPRLTRVQVQVIEVSYLELHFRISANLRADLGSEPVLFDAELPKQTRHFHVKESR